MMKKITLALFMIVMLLSLTATAYADDYKADQTWHVYYSEGQLGSDFNSREMSQSISDMEPGDSLSFSVQLETDEDGTDFWMKNTAVKSFEDNEEASGGAYTYKLVYSKGGKKTVLYDSGAVGGEDTEGGTGLHKATGALEDFFYLGSLKSGEKGKVTLTVALDGATQNNSYQTADAEIDLTFAAEASGEAVTEDPDKEPQDQTDEDGPDKESSNSSSVQTGDTSNMMPVYIIAAASGVLLLILAAARRRKDKKEGRENE